MIRPGFFRWLLVLSSFIPALCWSSTPKPNDYGEFGYHRVAAISPPVHLGDPMANARAIQVEAQNAAQKNAAVAVFPELSLTGYTAEDFFLNDGFLTQTKKALSWLAEATRDLSTTIVLGAPYRAADGRLYNVAFVLSRGKVIGAVPKTHLPNYAEFYERRWFVPGGDVELDVKDPVLGEFHLGTRQLFRQEQMIIGIEICEDVWAPLPPSTNLALAGANIILNLSASNELVGKAEYRRTLVAQQSERLLAAYVYVSSGPTESTKDLVFGGHSLIYENGSKLNESERFKLEGTRIFADVDVQRLLHERQRNTTYGNQKPIDQVSLIHDLGPAPALPELERRYTASPFVPSDPQTLEARSEEIVTIQAVGLVRRIMAAKAKTLVIGVSGGLDSTLALLVANEAAQMLAWSPSQIIGVTMPGFGTTKGTKSSAIALMESLGITMREVPITAAVTQHFKDIDHDPKALDVTYENAQARERTQILFDLANQEKGIVVGTGDLSELCLGWCTYNGDHMANYGVNAAVPKTLVKHLVAWYADHRAVEKLGATLKTILATEISPELLPPDASGEIQQSTESLVGPYRLHDFFIYHYLRNGFSAEKIYWLATRSFAGEYAPAEVKRWLKVFLDRYHSQQFKRTTLPSGPKVGSVSVSPRGDLRFPDEASCEALLLGLDNLPVE